MKPVGRCKWRMKQQLGPSAFPVHNHRVNMHFMFSPMLCGFQNPVAEQGKAGPTANGALDRLEPADLTLHWTGAPP